MFTISFLRGSREQTNFCARLRFLGDSPFFRRTLTRCYRMIPQKSGAEMARIRRPGTREPYPASPQDALSISVPQRRLTPFPARDGISLLNRIKTIRELPACRSCTARTSKRASDYSTLRSTRNLAASP